MLGGEGDDGRGAAERRRHRAGVEIVGAHDAESRALLDMDVAVDTARQDELARGIDLALGLALDARLDGGDATVLDGDVALGLAVLGDNLGVSNDQVVVGHLPTPPRPCAHGRKPRAGAPVASSWPRARRGPSPSVTSPAHAAWDS